MKMQKQLPAVLTPTPKRSGKAAPRQVRESKALPDEFFVLVVLRKGLNNRIVNWKHQVFIYRESAARAARQASKQATLDTLVHLYRVKPTYSTMEPQEW